MNPAYAAAPAENAESLGKVNVLDVKVAREPEHLNAAVLSCPVDGGLATKAEDALTAVTAAGLTLNVLVAAFPATVAPRTQR